ncbi:MAG: beta-N-acetylglucosaminidase domain-containing protein, partial [Actinomycetota bacterium]
MALIAGVIEGFYGPPWSHADRLATIDLLAENGGNWYVWAPKAAPRHR